MNGKTRIEKIEKDLDNVARLALFAVMVFGILIAVLFKDISSHKKYTLEYHQCVLDSVDLEAVQACSGIIIEKYGK